jgi:hypothetical protein
MKEPSVPERPSPARISEQLLCGAVSRWFLDGDAAWLLELQGRPELLVDIDRRIVNSAADHGGGGDLAPPDAVVSALEAEGHTDLAGRLQDFVEGAHGTLRETFDRLLAQGAALRAAVELQAVADLALEGELRSPAEILERVAERVPMEAAPDKSSFITVKSFSALPTVEAPAFAVDGLFYDRTFAIIGGDPKARKTTFALDVALGVLTGSPVLGSYCVRKRGPVVIVEADMGEGYFCHVLRELARAKGLDPDAPLPFPLSYKCATDIDLQDRGQRKRLLREIEAEAPALVLLDPLRDIHSGNENAPEELKPILDLCLSLRDTTEGLVSLIDHLVKPPRTGERASRTSPNGYLLRGAGSKYGRADSILIIQDLEGISEVSGTHRYGPPLEPFYFKFVKDETGNRLELSEKPEGKGNQKKSDEERIAEFLAPLKGFFSVNDIREGSHLRKENVGPALVNLLASGRVDRDDNDPPKWGWKRNGGPDE